MLLKLRMGFGAHLSFEQERFELIRQKLRHGTSRGWEGLFAVALWLLRCDVYKEKCFHVWYGTSLRGRSERGGL